MGVPLLLGVGEVFPSLTMWSYGICFVMQKSSVYTLWRILQTLDCWYFGSSEAFKQCLEWWVWWKCLLVPGAAAKYSASTHATDPVLWCEEILFQAAIIKIFFCLWCSAHHAVNELLQVVLVQVIPKQIHCAHVQRLQRGLGLSLQRSAQMQQKESKNVSVGQLVREVGVHASTA